MQPSGSSSARSDPRALDGGNTRWGERYGRAWWRTSARGDRALVRRAGAAALRRAPRHGDGDLGPGAPAARRRLPPAGLNALDLAELDAGQEPRRRRVRRRSAPSSPGSSPTGCAAAAGSSGPDRIGAAELAVFIVGPPSRRCVVGQWGDAVQTVIDGRRHARRAWAITSYGVVAAAALGVAAHRWRSCPLLFNVVVRALPLLLLFTTFLFINAEVWQVAGTLDGRRLRRHARHLLRPRRGVHAVPRAGADARASTASTRGRRSSALGGGDAGDGGRSATARPTPTDARRSPTARPMRQRLNIGLVTIFTQAIQITFVGLALTGFFVLFGFLAIPEATAAAWTRSTTSTSSPTGRRRAHARDHRAAAPRRRLPRCVHRRCTSRSCSRPTRPTATSSPRTSRPQLRQALAVRCVYRAGRAAREPRGTTTSTSGCSTTPAEMRRVMTLFNQVWGSTTPARRRRAAAGHPARRRLRRRRLPRRAGRRRIARVPRPPRGRAVAAQPRHRHPPRRPPHRARPGDEAAPAGVGRRARPGVGHVDVRSARAPQRLVQHRRARRPGPRVPRRLLRPDRRRHQRRRRERPPARRLAASADDRARRPATAADPPAPSPCRRPRTSSCCAAPTAAAATAWRHRLRDELGGRLAAGGRVVGFTRDGDYLVAPVTATCIRELREIRLPLVAPFRTSFGVQTSRRILLVRAEVDARRRRSSRDGASASPATSRRTPRSTSTVPRWSCATC